MCFCADEEEVKGLCGLHKTYETGGRNSDREMYPWMASIYVQVNVLELCLVSQFLWEIVLQHVQSNSATKIIKFSQVVLVKSLKSEHSFQPWEFLLIQKYVAVNRQEFK